MELITDEGVVPETSHEFDSFTGDMLIVLTLDIHTNKHHTQLIHQHLN